MPVSHGDVLDRLGGGLPKSVKDNVKIRYVLPFLLLARLDAKLAGTRAALLTAIGSGSVAAEDLRNGLPAARAKALRITQLPFYSTSSYSLAETLDPVGHFTRFQALVDGFSPEVRADLICMRILDHARVIAGGLLGFLGVLVRVQADIAPLSDHDFGQLFQAILQLLTEATADDAGDCATPADLAELATELLLARAQPDSGALRTIYDPACGTGGLLFQAGSAAFERLGGTVKLRGQEIKEEMAALASLYLLLRAREVYSGAMAAIRQNDPPTRVEQGNTLTGDGLRIPANVDLAIWNPPMGKDGKWEKFSAEVEAERRDVPSGRYAAGLPGVGDGSLLFLMHVLSKLKPTGRAVAFMNASPLFEGEVAETKNSQSIRLWLMENDYVDSIIALPKNAHFNTDIVTYLWVLDKDKPPARRGRVVLINAAREADKRPVYAELLKKNLNDKRFSVAPFIEKIVGLYRDAVPGGDVRVVPTSELKFKVVGVARPLVRWFELSAARVDAFLADPEVVKAVAGKGASGKAARALRDRLRALPAGRVTAAGLIDVETVPAWRDASPKFVKALVAAVGLDEDSDEPVRDENGDWVADPSLADTERVPWDEAVEDYLDREVRPFVGLARATGQPRPGCEINFNRFFYEYQPPRSLEAIAEDLAAAREEEAALFAGLDGDEADESGEVARPTSLFQWSLFGPQIFDSPLEAGRWAIPVVDLQAAAGAFSSGQVPEPLGWISIEGERADRGRFIAQVVGESMNRVAPNGEWCLWEHFGAYGVPAAAPGDNVIVRRHHDADAEIGAFTFKRLRERGDRVVLAPMSSDANFRSLDLQPGDRFIARFVGTVDWAVGHATLKGGRA